MPNEAGRAQSEVAAYRTNFNHRGAEQSTGCEEKNTNTSPQQPVLFGLTFNTAASL
jgi:hypothetical protein